MKNQSVIMLLLAQIFSSAAFAAEWKHHGETQNCFIENIGQFDARNQWPGSRILYAWDAGPFQVYFTAEGITYRLDKKNRPPRRDKSRPFESEQEWMQWLEMRRSVQMTSDVIHIIWQEARSDVKITARQPRPDYFNYSMGSNNISYHFARAYEQLVFENLYDRIDLIYEFHPRGGLKYSFILHPGADVSQIKLRYHGTASPELDEHGNLQLATQYGPIIDHAPITFYYGNAIKQIPCTFHLHNNILTFQVESYDTKSSIVIDPWTVFPSSPNSNKVWEVETDAAGNVYTYSGDMPITLRKYNSSGVLQWTYLTSWDSSGYWIGGMVVDPAGNTYMTSGSNGEIRKINTAGVQQWYNNPNLLTAYEYWSPRFNCDLTRLLIGGTRLLFGLPFPTITGTIMEINLNNGALMSTTVVAYGNLFSIPPNIQEVSTLAPAPNGNFYFLTLDTIGAINSTLSTILFKTGTGYNFDYYIPGYGFGTKQPISSLRASNVYVYSTNGVTLHQRDLNTGQVLASAAVPGGISTTTLFGTKLQGNSGLDLDSCGFIYVGSGNAVLKYNASLNLVATATTPGPVYDVDVNSNGEVIACGPGYVASLSMNACQPLAYICSTTLLASATSTPASCDGSCNGTATATAIGGSPPFTYLWSNGATTQTITGLCAGTYTVTITGSNQATATATTTVTAPAAISSSMQVTAATCGLNNGTASVVVTGGTPPFTYLWNPGGLTTASLTNLAPGVYYVLITDNNGCTHTDSAVVNSIGGPVATISATDVSCHGGNDGNAQVVVTSGSPPFSYLWSTTPPQTTAQATNLTAGNYTVTITDAFNCTLTLSVTVNEPPPLVAVASQLSPEYCGLINGIAAVTVNGGTPGYTYLWNDISAQTDSVAYNLTAGVYTVIVTDNNGCTQTATVSITGIPGPDVSISGIINPLCFGDNTGSAIAVVISGTPPYTFLWNTIPPQTTAVAVNLGVGTYTVVVTDSAGCKDSATVNITSNPALTATIISQSPAQCGLQNGTATVQAAGGLPPYSYSWSTMPVQSGPVAVNLPAGIYTVTVTDANGCTQTATVTITATAAVQASVNAIAGCGEGNGTVTVTVNAGTPPYSYQWTPGGFLSATVSNLNSGTYTVLITDASGCTFVSSVTLTNYSVPAVTITPDVTILAGSAIQLQATGGISYQWSPAAGLSCTACADPLASPATTTTYCVTVTNADGCTASACVKVTVDDACGDLFIPSAFSPDGAHHPENEKLCLYGRCIQTVEWAIYTRWGQQVFRTTNPKECWDGTFNGKRMNTGVYVYYLKATLTNGIQISRSGDITLIR
jgi:gliding motility-associated-like protein